MKARQRWTVSSDGASLAFWEEGSGPAVVLTNGFANSTYYWEELRRELRKSYRVIRWDLRGHGRSGGVRDKSTMTVAGCADDLRRVLDAAGVEEAVLMGFSFGCQVIFEAWRHFPERIVGLAAILGPCERTFDQLIHPQVGPLMFELFRWLSPSVWDKALKVGSQFSGRSWVHRLSQATGLVGKSVSVERMRPFYSHLGQIDAPSWHAMGISAQEHSARDILPEIDVPALVIAGGCDRFSPGALGEEAAKLLPRSELVWIDEATHTGLFDSSEEISGAVEEFLSKHFESTVKTEEKSQAVGAVS